MKILVAIILLVLTTGCAKEKSETNPIPDEVAHKKGYIKYLTPPENFKAVNGWITAIHDKNSNEPSQIEIDYVRLYARFNNSDTLLDTNEYNDGVAEGGLYMRQPWFGVNDNTPIPYEFVNNNYLLLKTSTKPDNVWHVWNKKWPRATVPPNAERCWLEVKCRITGSALIQLGIDFWREPTSEWAGWNVNNIESGVSDWYYTKDEWLILNYAMPDDSK
jgi:hypothetical protein